ncbi:MAG: dihydrofolate reductase [Clostridia bacterium]|nr:dihydrofolate reductase [Clostridia bacterium]
MIAILHADKEWGIGKKNDLMFSLPLDMKFFKETTMGKVVCMGYNTLLSLPNAKPLKNRTNILLCPNEIEIEGCICVHSVEELLSKVKNYPADDVFIIGGASVYKTLLPYCDKIYITKVNAIGGAEVFFHNLDNDDNFVITSESNWINDNGYDIKFVTYKNNAVIDF